jgi:hypothetical protein
MGAEFFPLLAIFSFLNVWLTYFNSWAVRSLDKKYPIPIVNKDIDGGGFEFPFFYSFFHCIMSCFGAYIVMRLKGSDKPSREELWEYRKGIMPMAALFVLNVGCNNFSLMTVSVFMNGIIKTLVPVPTMTAEYFINNITPTVPIVLSVLVISAGAALCVDFKGGSSSPLGEMSAAPVAQ